MTSTTYPASDRPHLLVGFAEALAAPESIWSLVDAGYRVTAFSRRGARPPIRRCAELDVVEVDPPAKDWQACLSQITDLAHRLGAAALVPFDDQAVWLCAQHALASDLPVIGPTGEQADFAIDKRIQLVRAREAGFSVPDTLQFESLAALASHEGLPFPIVVKRAEAVCVAGSTFAELPTTICADAAELGRLTSSGREDVPILVQPWLEGEGEGLFGLMAGDRLVAVSAHRRIRMVDPHGSGSSACVAIPPDPALAASTERMLAGIGWRGLFMVELLHAGDASWFIEFNGRTWGSMALARRIGFEYPAWATDERLYGRTEPKAPDSYPLLTCRHLGFEISHLLAVMKGPRSRTVTFPSRLSAAKDFLRVRRNDRWYNLRPGCRRVFVDDTVQSALAPLMRQARGRLPAR